MTIQLDIRKVQRLIGVKQDGVWGPQSEAALNLALSTLGGYNGSSQIPDDYLDKLAHIESGNRPYVKAPTSSASGLYQFIQSTWKGLGGSWGTDPSKAFGGLMPSVEEQTKKAKAYTQANADALAAALIPVTSESLYAAHFLGVGTAIRALGQSDSTPIENVTSEAQRRANPSILKAGSNVGQFKVWLARKTA